MYKLLDNIYLTIHNNLDETKYQIKHNPKLFITSTDYHEYYEPLRYEYGPINMGEITLFVKYISEVIVKTDRQIVYYVYPSKNNEDLLNALFLLGCYFIIARNYNVENILFNFSNIFKICPQYYKCCVSKYQGYVITITDCLKTIKFINENKFYDINKFDINEYLYYSNYQFRDMTLILDKFLAMTCPSNNKINDIIQELKKKKIKNIIRLNHKSSYDKQLFEKSNIIIHDLYFEDMTTPSILIMKKFMNIIDNNEIFAIHCNAGLGRTAILICIWLILKCNFKPEISIAYMRIMRPGSVMHHQGLFLESIDYFKKFI
tara:strand:- start:1741 stop:2694 length:954 start_codon:yes stop_codon:yes gene_type:complete